MAALSTALAFLKSHLYLLAIPCALLLFLWRFSAKRRKIRRQHEEMRQLQRRDEALTEALRNPRSRQPGPGRAGALEVAWDELAAETDGKHHAALMMELVERSGYSRRTYVFRADETVSVGSGGDCRLVVAREDVAERHCVFFMRGKRSCVRTVPGAKTLLKRGRETAIVSENGLYLNNGDHVQAGGVDIQFRLFKA